VPAGAAADFTLYWTPRAEISNDYITVFTLRTPDGLDVSRTNDDRPGGVETHHWRTGQYVRQAARIDVPAGTPPGTYSVYVQLFDPNAARPLDVISPEDTPIGIEIPLGTVEVVRAEPQPRPENAAPFPGPPSVSLDAGGLSLDYPYGFPETVAAGQPIDLTFLWNVRELGPKPDVVLEWRALDTEPVLARTPVTIESTFPFEQWQVGDWWYTWQRIFVPPQLEGEVVVVASANGETMFPQRITVTAPARVFELPDGVTRANAAWDNGISLEGYAEDSDGITLYWTVSEPVTEDLRRFAHIVGADGALVDVADGVPADWTRPVTGWLPSEYVADRVPLHVLSGQSLRLGFYDSRTNERVAVQDGGADYHDVIER
jgi:hypothetical protein